jgi:hypothetical protein
MSAALPGRYVVKICPQFNARGAARAMALSHFVDRAGSLRPQVVFYEIAWLFLLKMLGL